MAPIRTRKISNVNRLQQIARQYPGFVVRCSYVVMIIAFAVLLIWGISQSYEQQLAQQQQEVDTKALKVDKFLDTTLNNVNLLRSQVEYLLQSPPKFKSQLSTNANSIPLKDWSKNAAKYGYYRFDSASSTLSSNSNNFSLVALKDADIGAVGVFFAQGNRNLQREVGMSLSLAPLLRFIHEELSIEGRIRYTSLAALEMTYPATPLISRHERIKIFRNVINQEIITGGMPINNPDRKTYITHPYKDIFGEGLMLTATSPIYQEDKYLGNIGIDIKLEALNRFIQKLGGEHSLLLTIDGDVLSHQPIKNPIVQAELLKLFKTAKNSQVTIDGYLVTYSRLKNAAWGIADVTPIIVIVKQILVKQLPVICGVIIGFTGLLLININVIHNILRKLNQARLEAEGTNKTLQTALTKLEFLALTDKLTGAWNRRHFEQVISAEMSRALRHNQPLSLIILDIDYFKKINDMYGHQAGDSVLVKLSNILKENIRTSDILTRWGGEEFIILTPFTLVNEAAELGERLRNKIAKTKFDIVNKITISLGVAQFQTAENFTNFIKRADTALYEAKNNGRNIVIMAPSTLDAWIQETKRNM